ncbi:hypothetical protein [Pseudomonas sp. PS02290]|uniref:hypothetical protein n=1 Tax=Pseudomonas sp. PS02290 TaxID=2991430 RepID=UPI00249A655D|nr:hypothetical protein [Pseudomonas sp. PS02290]
MNKEISIETPEFFVLIFKSRASESVRTEETISRCKLEALGLKVDDPSEHGNGLRALLRHGNHVGDLFESEGTMIGHFLAQDAKPVPSQFIQWGYVPT